ncbi:hypothetical protein TARUN_4505 [Trichoderma arundinaceum]|uniref:Uncharacterized protein n=1 Tax=Trichoderma arundinaceum TaxID=490622 RepID=A0A395NNX0_TRIAR|nr:hypothetical protein TARUN_4505 [Trichoderma arundinaceum]
MDPPPSSQMDSPPSSQMNPPPSSQSHFDKFTNFTPNHSAPFDDEFARLALSQNWVPGSQNYTKERTIAMREELKTHYFSQSQAPDGTQEEPTEEDVLRGYQDLCREVSIPPSDSTAECKRQLKKTLVNIVDLIDARRTDKKVRVWDDFEAFRKYTLKKEHRISVDEAKEDGGYLASLLQHLRGSQRRRALRVKRAGLAKRGRGLR